LKVRIINETAF